MGRRDRGAKREGISIDELLSNASQILDIQKALFQKALDFRRKIRERLILGTNFIEFFTSSNKNDHEIHGGFAWVHWDRDPKWEEEIKNDLKVTIRCIPSGFK